MSGIHIDQTIENFSHDQESSDILYLILDSLLIVRSVSIFYIQEMAFTDKPPKFA